MDFKLLFVSVLIWSIKKEGDRLKRLVRKEILITMIRCLKCVDRFDFKDRGREWRKHGMVR